MKSFDTLNTVRVIEPAADQQGRESSGRSRHEPGGTSRPTRLVRPRHRGAGAGDRTGRLKVYELARRGALEREFQVRGLRLSKAYGVVTVDLLRVLGVEPPRAGLGATSSDNSPQCTAQDAVVVT
jgi:hypothetical protein